MTFPRRRATVAGILLALALGGVLADGAEAATGIEGAWTTNSPSLYMLTTQVSGGVLIVVLLTIVPASGVDPAFTVWEYATGAGPGGTTFAGILFDPTTPTDTSSSISIIFTPTANPPTADITVIDRSQRTTFRGTKIQ